MSSRVPFLGWFQRETKGKTTFFWVPHCKTHPSFKQKSKTNFPCTSFLWAKSRSGPQDDQSPTVEHDSSLSRSSVGQKPFLYSCASQRYTRFIQAPTVFLSIFLLAVPRVMLVDPRTGYVNSHGHLTLLVRMVLNLLVWPYPPYSSRQNHARFLFREPFVNRNGPRHKSFRFHDT